MERSPVPRRAAAAVVLLVLVVAAGIYVVTTRGTSTPSSTTSISTDDWALPRVGGDGLVSISDFRGKPTVVNLYASWCTPCADELPEFAEAAHKLAGRVTFVGVNSLETGDGLAMARNHGIGDWPLARDIDGAAQSGLHDNLGAVGMPVTAFYDADGTLRHVSLGAVSAAELMNQIKTLYGIDVQLTTPTAAPSATAS